MSVSRLIYQGRRISLVSESYTLPNGKQAEHLTVEHPGAIVVLPIDNQGKLVLIRQYRHSIRKSILEAPAGALEKGEDPKECAQREIKEEIGERAEELTDLGILYPTPGFCNEVQYLFLARNLVVDRSIGDDDEFIEVERYTKDDVVSLIKNGELSDGKTLAIILRAQTMGLI
jgi:ADP-ribose pyrophosphatase